jgi:hypothetical protein
MEVENGFVEKFIANQRRCNHSSGPSFFVPDHGSIEEAFITARLQHDKFPEGFKIVVRSGKYIFREPVFLDQKIDLCGEGHPIVVGSLIFEGGKSRISGVDFENAGGSCLIVNSGEVLLEHCNIHSAINRFHAINSASTALLCNGGLLTMRQCILGGKSNECCANDGIAVRSNGRVLAEMSKVSWCEYAISVGDNAQVEFNVPWILFSCSDNLVSS